MTGDDVHLWEPPQRIVGYLHKGCKVKTMITADLRSEKDGLFSFGEDLTVSFIQHGISLLWSSAPGETDKKSGSLAKEGANHLEEKRRPWADEGKCVIDTTDQGGDLILPSQGIVHCFSGLGNVHYLSLVTSDETHWTIINTCGMGQVKKSTTMGVSTHRGRHGCLSDPVDDKTPRCRCWEILTARRAQRILNIK